MGGTLRGWAFRHHQQSVVFKDDPSVRGMLNKVRHLVDVARPGEA